MFSLGIILDNLTLWLDHKKGLFFLDHVLKRDSNVQNTFIDSVPKKKTEFSNIFFTGSALEVATPKLKLLSRGGGGGKGGCDGK